MRIILALARAAGADRLIPVSRAHVDSVLYHGQVCQDFVEWLTSVDARVAVPTTLNVAALDLVHPWLFHGTEAEASAGRRLGSERPDHPQAHPLRTFADHRAGLQVG